MKSHLGQNVQAWRAIASKTYKIERPKRTGLKGHYVEIYGLGRP
jgi:hypothetical protein